MGKVRSKLESPSRESSRTDFRRPMKPNLMDFALLGAWDVCDSNFVRPQLKIKFGLGRSERSPHKIKRSPPLIYFGVLTI
ncbi:MAG: hypothetical protein HY785_13470 [Oscillatoriophycideae cyanobacterium NC_groundwater_1537_Pr4_S-0.65um_50_18]|nr:hypothetical protein [Oscillatoriophycideae cyanobacterium NC_groundwater_1537_Pr4_S-0.65um_50_18]